MGEQKQVRAVRGAAANPATPRAVPSRRSPATASSGRPEHRFRKDGTPFYVQLASTIRRQIADGSWEIGRQLPSLKELVTQFGLSSMTIRHALAGLEQEGLISAQRGRGTFVIARPEASLAVPYQLTPLPGRGGSALSFRVVASRLARGELRITAEDGVALPRYQYMKRAFARDGRPFITGEYLVAAEAYRRIPERLWGKELVSALLYDTKGIGLSSVRQRFRVLSSTPREAVELDIPVHDPVMQVRRIFRNRRDEVLCLAQLVYRTDGVVFDISIDVENRNRLLELGGFPE